MAWVIHYDEKTGELKDFYPTDKRIDYPKPTIDLSESEYIQVAINRKGYKVNTATKTLESTNLS